MKLPLILLTILHLLVDGICGAILANYALNEPRIEPIVFYFLVYTILAFGLQGPIGFCLDYFPSKLRLCLLLSMGLLSLGMLSTLGILTQVIFIGLGNCIFHVVGGSYVLSKYDGYTELGMFVASGAIGLGLGLNSFVGAFTLVIVAISCSILAYFAMERTVVVRSPRVIDTYSVDNSKLVGCVLLLLFCVFLRSFGSNGNIFTSNVMLLPCVFAWGKLLGGVVCDALGYKYTTLGIFVLGFLGLLLEGLWAGLLFILACNMTMPLTLRLVHWCRVEHPGLMFGLAASCLVPGVVWKDAIVLPPQLILVVQFIFLALVGFVLLTKEKNYV